LNLRGKIVTVIDLCKKIGLPPTEIRREDNRNIIVNSGNEYVGLLVEGICDIVQADLGEVQPIPPNIGGVQRKYFEGALNTDNCLIGILNAEEVLKVE
jgi:purine-binding chemotaxis protein CheW